LAGAQLEDRRNYGAQPSALPLDGGKRPLQVGRLNPNNFFTFDRLFDGALNRFRGGDGSVASFPNQSADYLWEEVPSDAPARRADIHNPAVRIEHQKKGMRRFRNRFRELRLLP
jgi:hypothetical protein